jgi:enamine deaminase RidA (YjgF/YER057c/UK114 family)
MSKDPIVSPSPTAEGGRPVTLNPPGWPEPRGYANGMSATGRIVVTGGVVGWDVAGQFPDDFAGQARQCFENIAAILAAGGATPGHIVRLTWYVTDIEEYQANLRPLGAAYRDVFGRHFPAMAVVQVVRLVEKAAKIEIEATAVIGE